MEDAAPLEGVSKILFFFFLFSLIITDLFQKTKCLKKKSKILLATLAAVGGQRNNRALQTVLCVIHERYYNARYIKIPQPSSLVFVLNFFSVTVLAASHI